MKATIRRAMVPPVFEGDEERTRQARVFHTLLLTFLAILLVAAGLVIPWLTVRKAAGLFVVAALLTIVGVAWTLLRRGMVARGAAVLVAGMWVVFTGQMLLAGGLGTILTVYYIITPIIAGLLLGQRSAIITAGACAVSGLSMVPLELEGWLPHYFPLPPAVGGATLILALIGVTIPTSIGLRSLREATANARRELADRTKAEAELRESEERYRRLAEFAPYAVFLQCEGMFVYMNPAGLRLFGASCADQIVGQPVLDRVHPDDRAMVARRIRTVLEDREKVGQVQQRYLRLDGTAVDVEVVASPFTYEGKPAGLLMVRDITLHKRAEDALAESEARYRTLFDLESDAILMIENETGRLLEANSAAAAMYGYSRDELLSMRNSDLSAEPQETRRVSTETPLAPERTVRVPLRFHRRKDGTVFPVEITGRFFEWQGRGVHIAAIRDIAERRRAEEAVLESEHKFATLFRSSPDMVGIVTLEEGRYLDINDGFTQSLGYTRDEVIGRTIAELGLWADPVPRATLVKALAHDGAARNWEITYRTKSGGKFIGLVSAEVIELSGSRCVLAVARDITDRKRAEEALRENEERLRLALLAANQGLYDLNVQTGDALVNEEYALMLGYDPATFRETNAAWIERLHPDDRERCAAIYRAYVAGTIPIYQVEFRQRTAAGDWKWILSTGRIVKRDPDGKPLRMLGTHLDITERKLAEAEIEGLARFPGENPNPVLRIMCDGLITFANRASTPLLEAWGCQVGQRLPNVWWQLAQAASSSRSSRNAEAQVGDRTLALTFAPVAAEYVNIYGLDVTERKQAEEALLRSETRYRHFSELTSDYVYSCTRSADGPYRIEWVGGAFERISGYTAEDLLRLGCWLDLVHPEDRARVESHLLGLAPGQNGAIEFRLVAADGSIRWVRESSRCVPHEEQPDRLRLYGTSQDLTERRRIEEEQRRLEEQIRRVQKLESLGVLAGGIAHDFNNLLMAILGNADLALLALSPASPVRQNIEEIGAASRRAAELCRQMLAYSGKGRFVVETFDLSELVREMTTILEVSISKKATLRCHFQEGLPAVEADATQVRQVVMNLITNASEALGEDSGVISISTGAMVYDRADLPDSASGADLPGGRYVFLEVSDTGCGMDTETQRRMFDPFFTTKFTGRGLGLAAVLGIVRGHGGSIKVRSTPGRGTTFTVLLPALEIPAQPKTAPVATPGPWQGDGTVLLVDDEAAVRRVGEEMLEVLGFRVLTAANGVEAVDVFRRRADGIACVILDLTMPRMNGEEAFRELRRIRRDVRVVLSSGYDEQDATRRFVGDGLAAFVQKPYTVNALREVLQRVLG